MLLCSKVIDELRSALVDSGEALGDLDDFTLLRFLRARNYAVKGAYKQLKETLEWRRKVDIAQLAEVDPPGAVGWLVCWL